MSDLISRQAALALAKDIVVPMGDGMTYRHRCIDPLQILELPSAQPDTPTTEIKVCPFRTYTEVRPAMTYGEGDITVTGFMPCMEEDCPAWMRSKETGKEYCKRLE
jgi:hypothetical protein